MATISSAGVGSGLDVRNLVDQLVAAEGNPVRTRLDRKEATLQEGLTSMASFRGVLSEFKTSLENLRSPDQLRVIDTLTSDDKEEYVSITSNSQATPTEFNLDVLQLAKSHKLTSTQFTSDTVNVGSGSFTFQFGTYKEAGIGLGQFVLNPDSEVHTVKIEPDNSNLRGISDAINKADIGIKTIVINSGDTARLIFSSQVTGENNNVRITVSDDDDTDNDLAGLSTLAYDASDALGKGKNIHEIQVAQNAKIKIDGIDIKSSSNTISDVIRGVTFDVHSVTDKSVNVRLELNNEAVLNLIEEFVTSYNQLMTTVEELTGFDSETQTAGPLSGDPSIRSIVSKLRRSMSNSYEHVNENFISLATIGIDTERNGKLKLDNEKLAAAIETDLPEVVRLFAKTGVTQDLLIEFVSATNDTEPGSHQIKVTKLATKGTLLGQVITSLGLEINETNNNYKLKIDGVNTNEITLTQKKYNNLDELATELQTRINTDKKIVSEGLSVSVSNDSGRLQIISNRFGSGSRVEVVSVDESINSIGLIVGKGTDGVDVAGSISKFDAIGSGQVLTGIKNVDGLTIKVLSGNTGDRQKVIFSRGVAEKLDLLINRLTDSNGTLDSRSEGFNLRLEDITKQRETLAKRLEKLEQRLMKQFTALDSSLGKMQKTSEFLSNQLGTLPGPKTRSNR